MIPYQLKMKVNGSFVYQYIEARNISEALDAAKAILHANHLFRNVTTVKLIESASLQGDPA